MPPDVLLPLALFLFALASTPLVAFLALRVGWCDRRAPEERARKPREEPVPPIGGLVLLVGLWLAQAGGALQLPLAALTGAFLLGLLDDLRGLSPLLKLAGQLAVGALLASELGAAGAHFLGLALGTVVACNAANTFDHADGVLAGSALLFLHPMPAAAALLAGFLPSNLCWRRGRERVPLAYLGDAGSHLIGVLLWISPAGLFALVLPLLDLARLARLRWREGSRPWIGDRRHLGHRLQLRTSEPGVVAWVIALSAPGALASALAHGNPRLDPGLPVLGALATAGLFGLALRSTSDPLPRRVG